MRDKYTDTIRIGTVSSIDPDKATAQVTFADRGDIVTQELAIGVPTTLNDRFYFMPAVGERVRVLMYPEAPSQGCILGSYYAESRLPPIGDANKFYVQFEDETLLEYDKALHKLTIRIAESGDKSIDIVVEGDVAISTSGKLTIEAAQDVDISADGNVSIAATQINLN